jgi:short-subunit dehydrogenase involved in D-alanine esterification of teichoic acids
MQRLQNCRRYKIVHCHGAQMDYQNRFKQANMFQKIYEKYPAVNIY